MDPDIPNIFLKMYSGSSDAKVVAAYLMFNN
jgi:hypothetical protein